MSNVEKKLEKKSEKKILEKSPMSGLIVPLAIVLVGAVIIFGITKMVSTSKTHRDLIQEMHTKTFGNRWVAAYELSKILASQRIPENEIPWVVENLSSIYKTTVDQRTKNFVIIALGSLKSPLSLPIYEMALNDQDSKVRFSTLTALANSESIPKEILAKILPLLSLYKTEDPGFVQAAIYVLAQHKYKPGEKEILRFTQSGNINLRYSSATALIAFENSVALPTIKEIMNISIENTSSGSGYTQKDKEGLKLNVLSAAYKFRWRKLISLIENSMTNEVNVKVKTKAKEVLNLLKN